MKKYYEPIFTALGIAVGFRCEKCGELAKTEKGIREHVMRVHKVDIPHPFHAEE